MMDIYTGIVALINSNISQLNNKTYPVNSIDNPTAPYCVYQTIGADNLRELDGYQNGVYERIQFDIYTEKYTELISLKTAFINLFKNYQGALGGKTVQSVEIINDFDGYEPETKYKRRTVELEFYY